MAENLKATHYFDGTSFENGTGLSEIEEGNNVKSFFYYNDKPSNANDYGCLYSWYAAVRGTEFNNSNPGKIQGVYPIGWHIPSDKEWIELELYFGMNPSDTNIWLNRGPNQGDLLKIGGSTGLDIQIGGFRKHDEFSHMDDWDIYVSSSNLSENHCRLFVLKANSPYTKTINKKNV